LLFVDSFFGNGGIDWDGLLKQFQSIVREENLAQTLLEQNGIISGVLKRFQIDYKNSLPVTTANRSELTRMLQGYQGQLDQVLGVFRQQDLAEKSLISYVYATNLQVSIYQELAKINDLSLTSPFIKSLQDSLTQVHISHVSTTRQKMVTTFSQAKVRYSSWGNVATPGASLSFIDEYTRREYLLSGEDYGRYGPPEERRFTSAFQWFRVTAFEDSLAWARQATDDWTQLKDHPLPMTP